MNCKKPLEPVYCFDCQTLKVRQYVYSLNDTIILVKVETKSNYQSKKYLICDKTEEEITMIENDSIKTELIYNNNKNECILWRHELHCEKQ